MRSFGWMDNSRSKTSCFRDANGRQRRKSTKTSDRKKAIKIAERRRVVGVVWNWAGGARQRPAPG